MAVPKRNFAQQLATNYYRAKLNLLTVLSPKWAADVALDLFTKPYANSKKPLASFSLEPEVIILQAQNLLLNGYKWRAAPNNDKKLLLIHGFSGNIVSFDQHIVQALALGYDVYAYEAPAHGKSGGKRLNVLLYSRVITDIMLSHGPFHGFIAHSLGGLSLMLSLHENELPIAPKVVLIAPATESTTAADHFFSFLQLSPALRKAFEQKIEAIGGNPLSWFSISRILAEVSFNILWLHDHADTVTPIKDVLPLEQAGNAHVAFHFTTGLGHSGIYKDAAILSKIIEFLRMENAADSFTID